MTLHMHAVRLARLVGAALILGACREGPRRPTNGQAGEPETPRAAPAREAGTTLAVRDTLPVDRTPETDPWLFEGIPNFEDLVGGRDGDWVVVLGSARRSGEAPAPTIMPASDPGLAAVQQRTWNAGRVPFVVASEEMPGLAPGLTVVVLGPFARADAERELAALRGVVPDAYLKAGW